MVIKRREIRIKVMQTLYAHEMSKEPIEKVKSDILGEVDDADNREFSDILIDKVLGNTKLLDDLIMSKVQNWEFERLGVVDRIILRMGISELLYFPEIPPKVSINESIDIAKDFCTRNSGKFVNGVLDSILDELRKSNKLSKTGRGLIDTKKKV